MRPNFVIIGAQKCGTTSLWAYLREHPEVFMSERKELDFFCRADWRDHLDWYEEQFATATEPAIGEASPHYSMAPAIPGVAAAVAETIPNAKLIYLVRDPLKRAVSSYVHAVAHGVESRPLNEAFAHLDDPTNRYVCASRYGSQLREYLQFFPKERVFVEDCAALLTERLRTLAAIFAFLGVDPSFTSERFEVLLNTRERMMGKTKLGFRLRETATANWIRRLPEPVSTQVANALRRVFWRPIDRYPALDPEVARRFIDTIRPDVEDLRDLTGKAFDSWTTAPDDLDHAATRTYSLTRGSARDGMS